METPAPSALIASSFSRVRSTNSFGRSTSSFIKSRRLVPTARNFARGFAATARVAVAGSLESTDLKVLIVCPPSYSRQLSLFSEAPCSRCLLSRMDLLDSGDNLGVGTTAANIAAHSLAYFVVAESSRLHSYIFRDVTDIAAPRLFEQRDCRANLSGRAVATLEAV